MFWFSDHEACGIKLPDQGLNLCPPASEGRFLTTGPQGKPATGCLVWETLHVEIPASLPCPQHVQKSYEVFEE